MTLADLLESTTAHVIAAAALIAALAYLGRLAWRAARAVARWVRWLRTILTGIFELVDDELTHNHGSSIKDDIYGMAVTLGNVSRDLKDMKTDLYNHLAEKEPRTP